MVLVACFVLFVPEKNLLKGKDVKITELIIIS